MDIYLVIDLIVIVALFGIGLAVLLKNNTLELNRIFAVFVLFVGVWIMANYVSNDITKSPEVARIADYLVFFFSYASAAYLLRFAIFLAENKRVKKYYNRLSVPILVIGLMSFTPLIVERVERQGSVYAVIFGNGIIPYAIVLLAMIAATIYVLVYGIRHTSGIQKNRLKVLLTSLYWSLPLLLFTEFMLPTLTGWFGLTNVGILSMLVLVFGLFYGIVKHRLFDLRFIIVRSLAYFITFGVISVVYGVVSYYLTTIISFKSNLILNDLLNVALIVVAINTYPPLKRVFDKATNRLFYRDAYSSETLLSELNKTLLNNVDVKSLSSGTSDIISRYIKPDSCSVVLKSDDSGIRSFGDKPKLMQDDFLRELNVDQLITITDDVEETNRNFFESLQHNNIALICRLTPSLVSNTNDIGYLVLGSKKSGNPYSKQDINTLTIVASELVIAIQNALRFEEIEKFNETLQEKVETATSRLQRANDKLILMDETKDEFISMASHQLRTPLTSIKGYVSMVMEGDAGPLNDMQKKLLDQAFISSQRMVYLIADLLNVSRLRTGKFVVEASPVNLATLIEGEVAQLVETAKGRGLELTFKKPDDFPTLMLDETKTRQVVMNFMDNAIYYTPTGGHITIDLTQTEKMIEFAVTDDGIGVSRHEQQHLFTKFFRAGNARKARPDGTGLGLFMAKKVIVAQGGAILFRSKEGKGSTFGFTFAKSHLKVPEQVQS